MADRKYTSNKKTEINSEMGKIPPQAVELEEAVLGALLLEKDAFTNIGELMKPEHFYKEVHQHIYKAIANLAQKDRITSYNVCYTKLLRCMLLKCQLIRTTIVQLKNMVFLHFNR